jgi:hypothetical protein
MAASDDREQEQRQDERVRCRQMAGGVIPGGRLTPMEAFGMRIDVGCQIDVAIDTGRGHFGWGYVDHRGGHPLRFRLANFPSWGLLIRHGVGATRRSRAEAFGNVNPGRPASFANPANSAKNAALRTISSERVT